MPAPRPTLTRRQSEVLTFIHTYRSKHGMSPTIAEMADDFGITKTSVHAHCEALVDKGFLTRSSDHAARNLEPVGDERVLLSSARTAVDEEFAAAEGPEPLREKVHERLTSLPKH